MRRLRAAPRASFRPPVLDQLAVSVVPRSECEQLDPVGAALEGADHAGGDADRVESLDVEDVVVELHPAGAADDDVDLLGLLVAVAEGLPLARLDAVEAEAGLLGVEVAVGEGR